MAARAGIAWISTNLLDVQRVCQVQSRQSFCFRPHTQDCEQIWEKFFLNPGSVGVNNRGHVPFILLDIQRDDSYEVQQYQVPYDKSPVLSAFEERKVPNREQIISIFY